MALTEVARPIAVKPAHKLAAELALALDQMGTTVNSPSGTELFRQGQPPVGVYIVRRGTVRMVRTSEDGRQTSRTVGRGHLLGLLATVCGEPYLKTAQTVEECELASVDRSRVMALLHRRTDFWLQAVEVIKDEMKLIRRQVIGSQRKAAG